MPRSHSPRGRIVSHLLLRLRQRTGMTQKELAETPGVGIGIMRKAERNGGQVDLDDLYRLVTSLGFHFTLFFYEVEERIPHPPGRRGMPQDEILDLVCEGDLFARAKSQDQLDLLRATDPVPPEPRPRVRPRPRSPRSRRTVRSRTR